MVAGREVEGTIVTWRGRWIIYRWNGVSMEWVCRGRVGICARLNSREEDERWTKRIVGR